MTKLSPFYMRFALPWITAKRGINGVHTPQQRRSMSNFRVVEHTVRCQHIRGRPGATEPDEGSNLRLAVKQYVPTTNPVPSAGDVTFIGAHANAFPKELYEPLWDDLYDKMRSLGKNIRGIWIADLAHQGKSGLLNERIVGDDPSWFDHARDILYLVNQHQDQMPHPIFGIGHSVGGMQLAHLALLHPALFQGLVLVDPVIQTESPAKPFIAASTYRRDVWPSRQDAIERFRSNKAYKKWDSRVFDKLLEYGLRDLPTELYPEPERFGENPVTLTTTKAQELYTYARPKYEEGKVGIKQGEWRNEMHPDDVEEAYPFYNPESAWMFRRIGELKPSVLYVFGEYSDLSSPTARQMKLDRTGNDFGGSGGVSQDRVKQAILPAGHLIPMERVEECADAISSFTNSELSRWEAETTQFKEQWKSTPRSKKAAIDDLWKEHIGPLPSKGKL